MFHDAKTRVGEEEPSKKLHLIQAFRDSSRERSQYRKDKKEGLLLDKNDLLRHGVRKFKAMFIYVDIDSEKVVELYNLTLEASDKFKSKLINAKADKLSDSEILIMSAMITINSKVKYVMSNSPFASYVHATPLDYYISNGGNCVAKSMMTLAVMQRLREDGLISGEFGFKANFMKGVQYGHMYVAYRGNDTKMIIDTTNLSTTQYGTKEINKLMEKSLKADGEWNYFDTSKLRKKFIRDSIWNSVPIALFLPYVISGKILFDVLAAALSIGEAFSWKEFRRNVNKQNLS